MELGNGSVAEGQKGGGDIKTKSESGNKSFVFFSNNCSSQNKTKKKKKYFALVWYTL